MATNRKKIQILVKFEVDVDLDKYPDATTDVKTFVEDLAWFLGARCSRPSDGDEWKLSDPTVWVFADFFADLKDVFTKWVK